MVVVFNHALALRCIALRCYAWFSWASGRKVRQAGMQADAQRKVDGTPLKGMIT